MTTRHIILLLGIAFLASLGGALAYRWMLEDHTTASASVSPGTLVAPDLVGARRPDYTLGSSGGERVSAADFDGKVVLANFWATWCAPCLQEMPSMERLHQTFKQTAFVLLGVSMDRQGAEVAQPFVENLKLTFPVLLDPVSEVARQYGVRGLPTTYLIDRQGRIRQKIIGARDKAGWEAAVNRMLV